MVNVCALLATLDVGLAMRVDCMGVTGVVG